jgi:hypothetical protein
MIYSRKAGRVNPVLLFDNCQSLFLVSQVNHKWVQNWKMQGNHLNTSWYHPFAYKNDILIIHVPHDIDGLFSLVHEFLARITFSFMLLYRNERLANRGCLKGGIRFRHCLDFILSYVYSVYKLHIPDEEIRI